MVQLTSHSIAVAKNILPRLVHTAEQEGVVTITRHGKTVAYIVSANEFEKITGSSKSLWNTVQNFRKNHKEKLMNISEEEVKSWRNKSKGRDVNF